MYPHWRRIKLDGRRTGYRHNVTRVTVSPMSDGSWTCHNPKAPPAAQIMHGSSAIKALQATGWGRLAYDWGFPC